MPAAIRCLVADDQRADWRAARAAGAPRPVDHARRAIGAYDGALRAIVHALKYDGRRSLARPLAALMRERGADVLAGADVVVPVPLHPSRRRERGFNQAADLARTSGPPCRAALARVRATATQAGCRRRSATATSAARSPRRAPPASLARSGSSCWSTM